MSKRKNVMSAILSVYISFVFIQSLFFKFSDSPETQHIFGTLESWAASLGLPGLFARDGIFSQYVIGSAELVASILILFGLLAGYRLVQAAGALMAMGIISGAIAFHLFTPLGIVVVNSDGTRDGGELFILACGVFLAAAGILWLRRDELVGLVRRVRPRVLA